MTEAEIKKALNYRMQNYDSDIKRIPVDFEMLIVHSVKNGEMPMELLSQYNAAKDSATTIGGLSKKMLEYVTVSVITICTRAAIEGGADPEYCYELGEVLLYQLERAKNIHEIREIFRLAIVMFVKSVRSARSKDKPYQISQCRNYISTHLSRKLTVREIAMHVGLHPHYISQLFLEYEGYTLRDYIQKEKVAAACHTLRLSKQTISEISQNLGYQSQSNFTQVFRKWQGMTPMEYRNLQHHPAAD